MSRTEHRARRRPTVGALGVTAVLAAAGLLFAVSATTAGGTELRTDRPDLPALIRAEQARVATRGERVSALRAQVDEATKAISGRNATVAELQRRAAPMAVPGGLEAVEGPGLVVTLDDAPRNLAMPGGAKPDDLVVHQQDVQAVVNAMWAGGAEAMMLQDQRVISTSAVRCVGNTLILQGQVYSPPYVITAVGDVAGMEQAILDSPTIGIYQQYVDAFGLGWQQERRETVRIPAFAGSLGLQYARVPGDAAASTLPSPTGTGSSEADS